METVLLIVHLLIAIAMVITILLQKSEGGALGIGGNPGGGGMGMFTARGAANLLSKTTAILAAAFIVVSLLLAVLASDNTQPQSIVDGVNGNTLPLNIESPNDTIPIVPLAN